MRRFNILTSRSGRTALYIAKYIKENFHDVRVNLIASHKENIKISEDKCALYFDSICLLDQAERKKVFSNEEMFYCGALSNFQDHRIHDESPDINIMVGWLKILPPNITRDYEIYNLHPGAIARFPELKGINPQDRVIKSVWQEHDININLDSLFIHMRNLIHGSVIHKVIAEVDEGVIFKQKLNFLDLSHIDQDVSYELNKEKHSGSDVIYTICKYYRSKFISEFWENQERVDRELLKDFVDFKMKSI
tara:strand:- start:145 stop:891 length:747 start_codon:yes stop_codon:yes gene_type:complete